MDQQINTSLFDFSPVFDNLDLIVSGFWATLRLSAAAAVLSLFFGVLLVGMRVSPVPLLRGVAILVINTLRNTPLTLVILLCASGINDNLGLRFSDTPTVTYFWWGVLGISVYTGTFVAEVLRSGINTVPLGQAEAARSIGLSFGQSLRMVILPQAFRAVIGPLGSVLIAMIKNTSIIGAVVYLYDLTAKMKEMFFDFGASIPIFLGIAAAYMVLTLPTGFLFGWLAKRMAVAR
ncbi:amino acid ABC transporter permease [Actinocorallia lasiicapitis]